MSADRPDIWHYPVVVVVFAITGTLALFLSRWLLSGILGLEGSLWSGPWAYRVAYVVLIPPSYSVILVVVGTMFGKRDYFGRRVKRMWARTLPWTWLRSLK